jgi:hypothetical protein
VRFSLIRLNHIPSPDGMHGAVPDAPHQVSKAEAFMVPKDHEAEVPAVVAVLVRDEASHPLRHELIEVVEDRRRVALGEVTTPPHQEPIQAFDDVLDVEHQPPSVGVRPDALLDPASGRMLGNFPQAFSHIGLVNTALNLTEAVGPTERRKAP